MVLNLPLKLTIFRLVFAVFFLPILLQAVLPHQVMVHNILAAGVFLLVSFTDFLDGYLARRNQQVTVLGKLLDPVADKLLVMAGLTVLVALGRIEHWVVILLLGREFFVMGLRLIAREFDISVSVSQEAKKKTVYQMITIAYLIAAPRWHIIEGILLSITLYSSLSSAYRYALQVFYTLDAMKKT